MDKIASCRQTRMSRQVRVSGEFVLHLRNRQKVAARPARECMRRQVWRF